jgi:hypothetical protein
MVSVNAEAESAVHGCLVNRRNFCSSFGRPTLSRGSRPSESRWTLLKRSFGELPNPGILRSEIRLLLGWLEEKQDGHYRRAGRVPPADPARSGGVRLKLRHRPEITVAACAPWGRRSVSAACLSTAHRQATKGDRLPRVRRKAHRPFCAGYCVTGAKYRAAWRIPARFANS